MTDVVARLRQLEAAATPGPWRAEEDRRIVALKQKWVATIPADVILRAGIDIRNEALIVAARNALPQLLDAAEALRSIRQRIPSDAENEDANGWGRVDAALAALDSQDESGTSAA